MSQRTIGTGVTEPIRLYATDSKGDPLPGLTDLYIRIQRESDGFFYDWNDLTFKTVGTVTTLDHLLTQIDATNLPGVYEYDWDTSVITNVTAYDTYLIYPLQTPGTDAKLPPPSEISVELWIDRLDATITSRASQVSLDVVDGNVDAILVDTNEMQGKLPTNNIMGSSVKTDKDDEIGAILVNTNDILLDTADMQPKLGTPVTNVSADIAAVKADTAAINGRLPIDPADESLQQASHTQTQADIAALNDISIVDVQTAMTNQGYTAIRAPKLDSLDATVSSRESETDASIRAAASQGEHDATQIAIGNLNDLSQAEILSDAIPFAGAAIAAILADTSAVDGRLPADPADESLQQAAHTQTQANIAALNDLSGQEVRDAMKLAPTVGVPGAGSVDEHLDGILADTSAIDARLPADPADESLQQAAHAQTQADVAALNDLAIADVQTALTNQGYTAVRAPNLDNLDATVSSRESETDAATRAGTNQTEHDATQAAVAGLNDLGSQDVRDAMKLAPTVGVPGVDSVDEHLDEILADTDSMNTRLPSDPADESLQQAAHAQTQADVAALNDLSQADVQAAMAAQGYTAVRAPNLDNLDAAVSTRAVPGDAMGLVAGALTATSLADSARDKIVDQTWREQLSDHSPIAGSVAEAISNIASPATPAAIAAAVWDELLAGHSIADSAAQALKDALASILAVNGRLPFDPADESLQQAAHVATQALISSLNDLGISDVQTALTNQGYTAARAPNLDKLDAAVSSRTTQSDILADATPFNGADVPAILVDTAAVDARLPVDPADESSQTAQHVQTQADIAALNDLDAAQVEGAVWDAPQAAHLAVGSTGESLNDAGSAGVPPTVPQIVEGVWNKDRTLHQLPNSTGEAQNRLDAAVTTRSSHNAADVDAQLSGTHGPLSWESADVQAALINLGYTAIRAVGLDNLDAVISSRSVPGDAMALVTDAVSSDSVAATGAQKVSAAVWDALLSAHAIVGSAGALLTKLLSYVELEDVIVVTGSTTTGVRTGATRPDGYFEDQYLLVDSGTERAIRATVGYTLANGEFTVSPPLPFTPEAGDIVHVLTARGVEDILNLILGEASKLDSAPTLGLGAVVTGSVLDRICNKGPAKTFNQATDSLEANKDRVG